MNEFKEEFSQLLLRYAAIDSPADNEAPEMPAKQQLSNQQILDVIHEVLYSTLNINLQKVESAALKTPANEIIVATPDAPDVLRLDYNQNTGLQNRFMSIEALTSDNFYGMKSSRSSLSSHTEEKMEMSDSDTPTISDNKKNEDKFSVLCKALCRKNEIDKKDAIENNSIFNTVEEAYKHTMTVMKKLEHLRQVLMPEARASRRLSSIMNLPPINQHHQQFRQSLGPSSNLRTNQRAKALRRSLQHATTSTDDMPETPTTSRPSLGPLQPPAAKKAAVIARPASKLVAALHSQPSNSRSTSNSSINTLESNKSVGGGSAKSPSSKRNSKYAHVQSTIPKPTSAAVKRKAAQ